MGGSFADAGLVEEGTGGVGTRRSTRVWRGARGPRWARCHVVDAEEDEACPPIRLFLRRAHGAVNLWTAENWLGGPQTARTTRKTKLEEIDAARRPAQA